MAHTDSDYRLGYATAYRLFCEASAPQLWAAIAELGQQTSQPGLRGAIAALLDLGARRCGV